MLRNASLHFDNLEFNLFIKIIEHLWNNLVAKMKQINSGKIHDNATQTKDSFYFYHDDKN